MTHARSLFGGALLAAGLAGAPEAANIQILQSYGMVQAGERFGPSYSDDGYMLGGGFDIFATTGTGSVTASSVASTDGLAVSFDAQVDAYAIADAAMLFTPLEDTTIRFEWNADAAVGGPGWGTGIFQSLGPGQPTPIFLVGSGMAGGPSSGIQEIDLDAGGIYFAIGTLFLAADSGSAFVNVTFVPTPATAGLLGMAGFAATARRRR